MFIVPYYTRWGYDSRRIFLAAMILLASTVPTKVVILDGSESDTFLADKPENFDAFFGYYFPVCVHRILEQSELRLKWKQFETLVDIISPMFQSELNARDQIDASRSIAEVPHQCVRKCNWLRKELTFKITLFTQGALS